MKNPNFAVEKVVPRFRKALAAVLKVKPEKVPILWTMNEEFSVPVLFRESDVTFECTEAPKTPAMKQVVDCWNKTCQMIP